jgi:hypothetical protein
MQMRRLRKFDAQICNSVRPRPQTEYTPKYFQQVSKSYESFSALYLVLKPPRLCPWSEKIPIFVGANQQKFYVDKCLLQLHSGLFRSKLADLGEIENEQKPLFLPEMDPAAFTEFVCWMSWGQRLSDLPSSIHSNPHYRDHTSYHLGSVLKAASFQNYIIWEFFRDDAWEPKIYLPLAEEVRFAYEVLDNDSKLRNFFADSLALTNPFEECSEGDEDYGTWCQLFKDFPELGLDVAKAVGNKNSDSPGHNKNIGKYMEEEVDLNKAWEDMILKARTRAEIEKDARDGCIRSKVELDHLNRDKEVIPEAR